MLHEVTDRADADERSALVANVQRASDRQDLYQVAALALRLIVEFPDQPEGFTFGARALRELKQFEQAAAVARKAMDFFPCDIWPWVEAGEIAKATGNFDQLASVGLQAKERFPDAAQGYFSAALALRHLGRLDEATSVAQEAVARFPNDLWPLLETGWIAVARGDNVGSLSLAETLRHRFPDEQGSHGFTIVALRNAGRFKEALVGALAAKTLFPREAWPYKEAILILRYEQRLDEAESLSADAIACFPGEEWALNEKSSLQALKAEGLIRLHQWKEADAFLASVGDRISQNSRLCLAWADVAVLKEDFVIAEARLRQFRRWFPDAAEGYPRLAKVLARLGRREEAEALCKEGIERFPSSADIFDGYAWVAQLSGDSLGAVARWREGQRLFPHESRFEAGLHDAEMAAFEQASADPQIKVAAADRGGPTELNTERRDARTLLLQFQSMGSPAQGCEFGNVQRHFGAEPLGLLRWVASKPKSLAYALRDQFEGFWDEAATRISLGAVPNRPEDREYRLYFYRYDMHIHTLIYLSEVNEEEFIKKFCRRQRLLSRKFMEDLESAECIFVYKQDALEISDAEIDELLAAMHQYGKDSTLLFVQLANAANPEGTVKWIKPGLLYGYIDSFIMGPDGNELPIRFDAWLAICNEAYRLWSATKIPLAVTA
jgi:tetratricopeptide (TPR) repeat protein